METIRIADLPPVARTLLIPLTCRAAETGRPDAMIRDDLACAATILVGDAAGSVYYLRYEEPKRPAGTVG